MTRHVRRAGVLAALAILTIPATACGTYGVNSLDLPGMNVGPDPVEVVVEMDDVQNLVPNSLVKAANVTVGAVRDISTDGTIARLHVQLRSDAELPRNSTVTLGQVSVLGSQYLEFVPTLEPSVPIRSGDLIKADQTRAYPSTERVLSALSLVLNGSGLQQIESINSELNGALSGRTDQVRSLIENLQELVSGLNDQRAEIVRAIDELDRFSTVLASRTDTIEAGLTSISPGLDLLAEQRIQLTEMLGALGNFGQTAHQVVSASYTDLRTNLKELSPVLSKLAESGSALPGSLLVAATFPFPVSTIDRAIRGDFVNLFMTLDLSAETITQKVLPSIPKGAQETIFTALQAVDPLLNPSGRSPKVGQR